MVIILSICILIGSIMIFLGLLFIASMLKELVNLVELDLFHILTIERTRLRIELTELEYEIPEWLLEDFELEEAEESEGKERGKILKLVRNEKTEEKEEDPPEAS